MMFVLWDDQCQAVESGEDGTGWPTFEAALTACDSTRECPAYINRAGRLVLGYKPALLAAQAKDDAADKAEQADSARRAATLASILASIPAPAPTKPDRAATLAKMLANNEAALAACKKTDKAEISRLRDNCARLRVDLGIKTPEEKLLSAIFG